MGDHEIRLSASRTRSNPELHRNDLCGQAGADGYHLRDSVDDRFYIAQLLDCRLELIVRRIELRGQSFHCWVVVMKGLVDAGPI